MTTLEKRRLAVERAMPDVKKLVRKHGRTGIQSCLNKLRDYEMKVKQLELIKREAAKLERQLSK